jgi:hypothetical protein
MGNSCRRSNERTSKKYAKRYAQGIFGQIILICKSYDEIKASGSNAARFFIADSILTMGVIE